MWYVLQMVIVENNEQLSSFLKIYSKQDSILIPIQCDEHKHSVESDICLLYVQMLDGDEYILSYNHSESLNLDYLGNRPVLQSDTK